MPYPPSPPLDWAPSAITLYPKPSGKRFFLSGAPWVYNTIVPYDGLAAGDLTPDGIGSNPIRVCLGQWGWKGGIYQLIPPDAYSFKVSCHLYRAVADAQGNTDISCIVYLPGHETEGDFNSFCVFGISAVSGAPAGYPHPPGTLVESMVAQQEIPNLTEGADHGVFYIKYRGITPLGAAIMLRVHSYEAPDNHVPASPYPLELQPTPELLLTFDDGVVDSSPNAHSIINSGVAISAGVAVFDGTDFLALDLDAPIVLDGDFTIRSVIKTGVKSLESGSQRRIISFGGLTDAAPGIYIDQTSGAACLLEEFVAPIKNGAIDVATNAATEIKWTRESGVNALHVNGVQDGATFNDARSWNIMPGAEVGRLMGTGIGRYSGEIHSLEIFKGVAL